MSSDVVAADREKFRAILRERLPQNYRDRVEALVRFRDLIVEENARQNLTRIVDPEDFWSGHIVDAIEVLKSGFIEFPAMDLGSGAGVPGLLCAVLGSGPWVLAESEGHKADFLRRAASELGLNDVEVVSDRAENALRRLKVGSVVVRAVGPVERIYNWIRPCSTWNNLVLLKGPKWAEEWADFQKTGKRHELSVQNSHEYSVKGHLDGQEYSKARVIIQISRVPRGTKKN